MITNPLSKLRIISARRRTDTQPQSTSTTSRHRHPTGITACAAVAVGLAIASFGAPSAASASAPTMTLSSAVNGVPSASPYITQTAALTAHLGSSLTGTTYFVRLYDTDTGSRVGSDCLVGTTCTWYVKYSAAGGHHYSAHLDSGKGGSTTYPNVSTATTMIDWKAPSVTLTPTYAGSPVSTVQDDMTVTLTASVPISLTGTGLFLRIVNSADNSRVSQDCATGSICSVDVVGPAVTRVYEAHLDSNYGATGSYPNVSISARTPVSWTSFAYRISVDHYNQLVTATVSGDITHTPYYVYVMDTVTKTWLGSTPCGTGTTCSVVGTPGHPTVAFLASGYAASPSFPPAQTVASSGLTYPQTVQIH